MTLNLEIDGGIGRAGIWRGEDREPYINPRAHLDRIAFHTDLDYIRVIEKRTFTLNLPARTSIYQATGSYTLFEHGKPGIPFILGTAIIDGERAAFSGSVPVQMGTIAGGAAGYYGRWLALGADFDNVAVHEYVVGQHLGGSALQNTYPALAVDIEVFMTSKILEGPDVPPPQHDLEISLDRFAVGPMDSNTQYFRRVSDPARKEINAARGRTFEFNVAILGSGSNAFAAWRWRSGSPTQVGQQVGIPVSVPDGFNEAVDLAL